jgi:adenylate cyclase
VTTYIKACIFGLVIGLIGLVLSFLPLSRGFEEDVGLGLLFQLRGVRPPPTDVVVVSIDHDSSDHFNVPNNPDKWPRSLHARLTDRLVQAGASVITFDVHFLEPRSPADDQLFETALKRAGNVVLADALRAKEVPMGVLAEAHAETNTIVKISKPYAPFKAAAAGTGPFVLPRIPFKVNQYWTFQQGAGDAPTFPVLALQFYAARVYAPFIQLVEQVRPDLTGRLPQDFTAALKTLGLMELMRTIRDVFEGDPLLAEDMLNAVEHGGPRPADGKKLQTLKALIKMYGGAHSRYINFFGPPRTIPTIPFYQALELGAQNGTGHQIDLKDKAVFVGLSEIFLAERKDSFYTVFSQANGVFIGGVEIAATAFANILGDSSVVPISLQAQMLLLLFWGLLMGMICRMVPTVLAAGSVLVLGLLYLGVSAYQFQNDFTWSPLVIPLLVQAPLAFGSAVLWNYFETDKERKNMREAFGYYLPNEVVDSLAKDLGNLKGGPQVVYGTCLFTDAANYTTLSEKLNPQELSDMLGKYFEALFTPVREHGGLIVDLKGDSILAIWKAPEDDPGLRKQACLAALDIAKSVDRFNLAVAPYSLPTRIGLHAGQFTIGTVGAVDHYEYRPAGDVVNTASRVEGFNKSLGTTIAVTDEVIHELDGFLTKDLGQFRLKGKANALGIHELVSRLDESDEALRQASTLFSEAMGAFREQSWNAARELFTQCADVLEEDGPSEFYIKLCDQYLEHPPEEAWDAVVTLEKK